MGGGSNPSAGLVPTPKVHRVLAALALCAAREMVPDFFSRGVNLSDSKDLAVQQHCCTVFSIVT